MDQRKVTLQLVGQGSDALGAARIRRDDHTVFPIGHILLDPLLDPGLGVHVVDGKVEETLLVSN